MEFMSKLSVAEDSLDETDCTTHFKAWINLAAFNDGRYNSQVVRWISDEDNVTVKWKSKSHTFSYRIWHLFLMSFKCLLLNPVVFSTLLFVLLFNFCTFTIEVLLFQLFCHINIYWRGESTSILAAGFHSSKVWQFSLPCVDNKTWSKYFLSNCDHWGQEQISSVQGALSLFQK